MELSTFTKRAEVSASIRTNRDDKHIMFQIDNPDITYSTDDLAAELGFSSNRQFRDRLNAIEKEQEHVFNRAGNNHYALTVQDVIYLTEYLNIPKYKTPNGKAFVVNVANLKGGAGKTTTSVMIADGLTLSLNMIAKRLRVLLVDLDPQGSTTKQLLGNYKPKDLFSSAITLMSLPTSSISKELIQDLSIEKTSNSHVDIIPCTTEDGFLAPELAVKAKENGMKVHELLQKNVIDFVTDEYDVILIDAGPHLDDVFLATLGASHGLVTPIPPKELDFDSTLKFIERIPDILSDLIADGYQLSKLQFSKAFLNMWNPNVKSTAGIRYNKDAIEELEDIFGEADLFSHHLPNENVYQRCADSQKTVFSMSSTTYSKELGDAQSFNNAKKSASEWLSCVWKAIRFAHTKI